MMYQDVGDAVIPAEAAKDFIASVVAMKSKSAKTTKVTYVGDEDSPYIVEVSIQIYRP